MPRRPRRWAPNGIYHITVRGNNRQAIFCDQIDFQRYLLELSRCRKESPHRVLAFALMPNHVHLLLEASAAGSLSEMMRALSVSYTRFFNHRHHRVGQLYQGRFYSNLVDREAYLLEVTRYIHLNPVRARLVPYPADYLWSSFRIYLGLQRDALDLVDCHRVLELFGVSSTERVRRYQQFVEELAQAEQEAWLHQLSRHSLIPPVRWLQKSTRYFREKVPGTF